MDELDKLLEPSRNPSTAGTLAYLLFGLLVWSLQLVFVYGGHTLVCALGAPHEHASWLVIAATLACIAALAVFLLQQNAVARWIGLVPRMRERAGLDRIAQLVAVLAGAAVLWTGATALLVSSCVQGR